MKINEPDYIELGMIEAEKDNGFSAVQRGALPENEVALSYRALNLRPRVPYVAPEKTAQIPNEQKVLSVEVKRVLLVVSVATPCGIIVANGAIIAEIIAAAVAPFVGIAIACAGLGVLISCLGNIRIGKTVVHEHHHHKNEYKQYNNSGNGQNNSL